MWRICMELFFIDNIFRSKNLNYQNPKIIFRHRQEYYTLSEGRWLATTPKKGGD